MAPARAASEENRRGRPGAAVRIGDHRAGGDARRRPGQPAPVQLGDARIRRRSACRRCHRRWCDRWFRSPDDRRRGRGSHADRPVQSAAPAAGRVGGRPRCGRRRQRVRHHDGRHDPGRTGRHDGRTGGRVTGSRTGSEAAVGHLVRRPVGRGRHGPGRSVRASAIRTSSASATAGPAGRTGTGCGSRSG